MKIRNLNISAACLQLLLCIGMISWLISRFGEPSPLPLAVSLDSIVIMLIVFTFATFIFHLLYALNVGNYDANVESGTNWMRWVEYTITASIMIWVIAISSGVRDTGLLVFIVSMSVLCMLCGLLSEHLTNGSHKIWITLVGWAAIITAYSFIIMKFVENVNNSPNEIPGFVYAIISSMCIMYMSFGVIHAYHLYKGKDVTRINRNVEMAYTIDSMISKTLLVGLLFGGLIARNSAEEPK
jgi:hypothetical protein